MEKSLGQLLKEKLDAAGEIPAPEWTPAPSKTYMRFGGIRKCMTIEQVSIINGEERIISIDLFYTDADLLKAYLEIVRVYAEHNKKVEAIKFLRKQLNLGLKEAKDIVDTFSSMEGWELDIWLNNIY